MISLEEQIACIEREIAIRERVYATWVASGRMTKQTANTEIARMKAVRETLANLESVPKEPV